MNRLTRLTWMIAVAALMCIGTGTAWADGSAHGNDKHKSRAWSESTPVLRTDGAQVPGGCPIESPAGRFLFTARNPGTGLDIYVNRRPAAEGPFEPGNALPMPANDPGLANDFCPTPRPDAELYFVSTRSGGCSGADIHRAVNDPATGWSVPENLGCDPE